MNTDFRKSRNKAILIGALIGGLSGPLFLGGMSLWFYPANRTLGGMLSAFVLFLLLAGPGSIVAGGFMGGISYHWQQRAMSSGRLGLYAGLLGAVLGNGVSFASLGFMCSFGAIAHRLTIPEWVGTFSWLFVGFVPRASLFGLLCGLLIAFTVRKTKGNRETHDILK